MVFCTVSTAAVSLAPRAPCAAVFPKRLASRAGLSAAARRPMAAAAAPAAAPAAGTTHQHSNMVPFVRPGSASWRPRDPMYSWYQMLPEPWAEPAASGRTSAPLMVPARPTAYASCTGDAWQSPAAFIDLNAGVAPCFAGLKESQWRQVAVTDPCLHGRIVTLLAASEDLWAPTAAHLLRRLCAECGPALALVAPGGTSALATLPGLDLLALFQRAASCVDELAASGKHAPAVQTALAALQLLSHLRFGTSAAAEPYKAVRVRLKTALGAAASQPAVRIDSADVLYLMEACVRADRHLWLAPWVCHRWAAAVDAQLSAGWPNSQTAVLFVERWCALVARGRLHFAPRIFTRMMEAAAGGEQLSTSQMGRLLAAEAALPAHHTSALNSWLARWTAEVGGRRADRLRAAPGLAKPPATPPPARLALA